MAKLNPTMTFREFYQISKEQWLIQPTLPSRLFVRLFGTLGINSRIRNGRIINTILRLNIPQNARILDAGCGHAYALFWLAKRNPEFHLTGIDVNELSIQECQVIASYLNTKNVHFHCSSILDLDELHQFDLIYSMDVLEHIKEDVKSLQKLSRALKPDGKLILHLPRRHQENKYFLPIFKQYRAADHVRDEYSVSEIKNKLEISGFQVEYFKFGYSFWGELAFETNYLFWNSPALRTLSALLCHPLSVWMAYKDIQRDHNDGNSFIIVCNPKKEGCIQ